MMPDHYANRLGEWLDRLITSLRREKKTEEKPVKKPNKTRKTDLTADTPRK
jgi:hypothetical protein